jgi:uncharacterized protein (TIGR03663 family)
MATVEDEDSPADPDTARPSETTLLAEYGIDRIVLAVGGVVALALFLRLFALGARVAHWDEARVGWWILDYIQTGNYEYRPIIHGPFHHHVNKLVFDLFGTTDASMRLVTALLGGLLPVTALGLRHRLRDTEVVALALFLAVNPVLLYYSRFMRGDPIVGVFMFTAFVLFLRAVDFGQARYLFAGVTCTALAFTAKENAILYLVTWVGATALVVDRRFLTASDRGEDWKALARGYLRPRLDWTKRWAPFLLLGVVWFVVVIVFFYAPRASDPGDLGLYNAFGALGNGNTAMLFNVVNEATIGSWEAFYGLWVEGGHQDHAYLPFLGDYLETMGYGALTLSLLAIVGFLADRYSDDGPRDVVGFAFYWGFASVLGYPIVTDIKAPWATIHAVVPLAIPAAVGLALIFRWGKDAMARDDSIDVGITLLLIMVIVGQIAGAGLWTVYLAPQQDANKVVQYAQPAGDMKPTLEEMQAASAGNRGTDVLVYGDFYVDGDTDAVRTPSCVKWFNALPMPWYFEVHDSRVGCAENESELRQKAGSQPPIVVARDKESENEPNPTEVVTEQFPEYEQRTYELRTYGTETTFFVHPDYARNESGA